MKEIKAIVNWVGSKRVMMKDLRTRYPRGLGIEYTRYVEPFVGGGTVLADILSSYFIDTAYVSDANRELINMHTVVRDDAEGLMSSL